MPRPSPPGLAAPVVLALLMIGCSDGPAPPAADAPQPTTPAPSEAEPATTPADRWWSELTALCGNAYAGALVSADEVDADFADQSMTFHVRRCTSDRLEVPFHVGEDRSRTWVLTRTDAGLRLQHDHRHEDGSEDPVTLYGGTTEDPGTETAQHFPADAYSQKLFLDHGLDPSVANVWTMELLPGERFSYILRRPERHFQVDFDLTQPVDPPPAPWGHG
ncbi:MAG: hypothetical protein AAGN66_17555 [Acidobacteriota bacterium]